MEPIGEVPADGEESDRGRRLLLSSTEKRSFSVVSESFWVISAAEEGAYKDDITRFFLCSRSAQAGIAAPESPSSIPSKVSEAGGSQARS